MRTRKAFRSELVLAVLRMGHPSATMAIIRITLTLARLTVITGQAGLAAASSLEPGRGIAAAIGAADTMDVHTTEAAVSMVGEVITVARRIGADTAAIGVGIMPADIAAAVLIVVAAASAEEQYAGEAGLTPAAGFTAADTADAGKFA